MLQQRELVMMMSAPRSFFIGLHGSLGSGPIKLLFSLVFEFLLRIAASQGPGCLASYTGSVLAEACKAAASSLSDDGG